VALVAPVVADTPPAAPSAKPAAIADVPPAAPPSASERPAAAAVDLQAGWQGFARAAPAADTAAANPTAPAVPTPPPPATCGFYTASFGGERVQVIRSVHGAEVRLTLLTVEEGRAGAMTEAFMAVHAKGGAVIGAYRSTEDALAAAKRACPSPVQ
jgi:hypothetical protein